MLIYRSMTNIYMREGETKDERSEDAVSLLVYIDKNKPICQSEALYD